MGILQINELIEHRVDFGNQLIPDHTAEALEHYFLNGWRPGGFVEACLAGDLFRAVTVADHVNKDYIYGVTKWIVEFAPQGSYGGYDRIDEWCDANNEFRKQWAEKMKKEATWRALEEA